MTLAITVFLSFSFSCVCAFAFRRLFSLDLRLLIMLRCFCLHHAWDTCETSLHLKRNLSRRLLQIGKWSQHPSLRWLLIDRLEAKLTQCLKHWIETQKWLTFHCKISSALKEMVFHYVEWSSEIDCHHDTDLSQENLKGHFKLSWYELKRLK